METCTHAGYIAGSATIDGCTYGTQTCATCGAELNRSVREARKAHHSAAVARLHAILDRELIVR